ncbi:sugar transferase [Trichocoleus sp. FACHB-591]|uniref:heterocyst development glycosyltransferase HepC n=1 Tax=Trichocoleus sp. FACHB-591 TaxID=2692872 RepID=UPI00168819FA|nr:heterocyst development glycosyltransferase HepC [Trichocoleus sp. FACHB-591]MBD2095434.1 sugar transferase [Trichocoleus sp. FACHB-591]
MNLLSIPTNSVQVLPKSDRSFKYELKWRQKHLVVRRAPNSASNYLPSLESQRWLIACLKRSPIRLISLAPDVGEEKLRFWADACEQAGKSLFLTIPNTSELPKKQSGRSWRIKRLLDRVAAAIAILLLSPVFLAIALLVRLQSPGPILFCQWRVGERGRLFRIYKFRTMSANAEQLHHQVMGHQPGLHKHENDPRVTPNGRWLRKYSLDELPQLFNVLRGEMSFVGPRPWALYDAVRISPEVRQRLNALPGITGPWQVMARSNMRDIDTVNRSDLKYLRHWSLWQDLKILLLTVPKVLTGFGAY